MGLFSDIPEEPNGDVRVCLDPSNLNKAIIREHHKLMTVEEIAHELAGATVYTKADALKAFLQIHLTHEASPLDDVQLSPGTALILTDAF